MSERHPRPSAVRRFFIGPPPEDTDAVAAHLLRECAECDEVVAALWAQAAQGFSVPEHSGQSSFETRCSERSAYADVLARVIVGAQRAENALVAERLRSRTLLATFLTQPPERQLLLIRNSRRYQTWTFCEHLLDASFELRHDDPAGSESLARVAVEAAALVDPIAYGDAVWDLRARAWGALANYLRILGEFSRAEAALLSARRLLAKGTGSLIDEAWICDVEGSLLSARRRLPEAFLSLNRSLGIYAEVGERHLLGRVLIAKGNACGFSGRVACEIVLARTGLSLIDPRRDPRVALAAWHNLCLGLHRSGHDRQALGALARARPLYVGLGDRTNLLRFQWLEGSIASSLGRDEQAEGCLRETRDGFVHLGVAFDAALVSLDLASLLLRQGRIGELRQLAAEMIAIFESRESRTEALAALILLRQAAERERVTEALLQRLRVSLRDAHRQG